MVSRWAKTVCAVVLGASSMAAAQGVVFVDRMESLEHWRNSDDMRLSVDKTNRKEGYASLRMQYVVDKGQPGSVWAARTDVNLDRVPKQWEFFVSVAKNARLQGGPKFRMAIQDKDGTAVVADIDSKAQQAAMTGEFLGIKVDRSEFVPLCPGKNNTLDNVATVSFEIIPRGGEFMFDGEYEMHLDELSAVMDDCNEVLAARGKSITARADELQKQLDALTTLGSSKRYPQATMEVIRMFVGSAHEENAEGKPVRAARQLEYLDSLCEELTTQLAEVAAGKNPWPMVPERNYCKMSTKGGDFTAGGEVVYPTGCCGWWAPGYFPSYARLGFSGLTMESGVNASLPEEGKRQVPADVVENIKAAGEHNLTVDLLLTPHGMPQWVYDKYPTIDPNELRRKRNPFMPWNVDSAELKTVLTQHIETLVPGVREFGNLTSYDVTNEMWYAMLGDFTADDFRGWLKTRYTTIAALNAAWGTKFADFAEVQCPIDSQTAVADRYVFQEFRVDRFYRWYVDAVHKVDATRPVYSKTHGGWRQILGVDRTELSKIFNANGTDCYPRMNNPREGLTVDAWSAMMITHEFRSLSPDKPIFDTEDHIVWYYQIVTPEYIRGISWWRSVLGLDVDYVWVWGRGIENGAECIFTQPWAVRALGQVSLDRQRLAATIDAFQSYRPDVLLIDAGPRVTDAYAVCSYAGVAFDFLPTQAVSDEVLKSYRTVIVPPTAKLDAPLTKALADAQTRGVRIVELGDRCELGEVTGAMTSKISPTFVPTAGVVQYTVLQASGQPMTFLLNLTPEPMTVKTAVVTTKLEKRFGVGELQSGGVTLPSLEPVIVTAEVAK